MHQICLRIAARRRAEADLLPPPEGFDPPTPLQRLREALVLPLLVAFVLAVYLAAAALLSA
jgi:hypothetical protein